MKAKIKYFDTIYVMEVEGLENDTFESQAYIYAHNDQDCFGCVLVLVLGDTPKNHRFEKMIEPEIALLGFRRNVCRASSN